MGVYIKGAMMPKDCETCFILNSCQHRHYEILEDEYGYITKLVKEDCPLVEVAEPHGRLIDADEIITQMNIMQVEGEAFVTAVNYVKTIAVIAPTVIESEE